MLVFTSVDTLKAQNTFLFRHKKKEKEKKGKVVRWKQGGKKRSHSSHNFTCATAKNKTNKKKRQYRCFMQIR